MKKTLTVFLALLLFCSSCLAGAAAADGDTIKVGVHYQLDVYEDRVIEVAPKTSYSKISAQAFTWGYTKTPDGYTFLGWYFDPECTQPIDRNTKPKENVDIYGAWEVWDEKTTALFAEYYNELEKGLKICMTGSAYETRSYCDYYCYIYEDLSEVTQESVAKMRELREALIPLTDDPESHLWYIWGDQMAVEPEAAEQDFTNTYDPQGFIPYIDAYLVEDQSQAKGSIFVCSGGAYTARNNYVEADPTANYFRNAGYNAYVVNYRLKPYDTAVDSAMDLQRAIRYVLYHADELGLGGTENLATIGFSAGANCVENQALYFYGAVTPDMIYSDYVCDDVDMVDFHLDVCMPIYGAYALPEDPESYNPKLPSFFLAFGTKDTLTGQGELDAFASMWGKVPVELHVYSDVPHAFGIGEGYEGANQIGIQIEAFLDVEFEYRTRETDSLTVWRGIRE